MRTWGRKPGLAPLCLGDILVALVWRSPTFWHWYSVTVVVLSSAVDSEKVTPRRARRVPACARAQASNSVLWRAAARARGPRLPTWRVFPPRFPGSGVRTSSLHCSANSEPRAGPLFNRDGCLSTELLPLVCLLHAIRVDNFALLAPAMYVITLICITAGIKLYRTYWHRHKAV